VHKEEEVIFLDGETEKIVEIKLKDSSTASDKELDKEADAGADVDPGEEEESEELMF